MASSRRRSAEVEPSVTEVASGRLAAIVPAVFSLVKAEKAPDGPSRGGRPEGERRSRALPMLFPGDRTIWWSSLVAIVPMLAVIAYTLVEPRSYYAGTDSTGVRSIVASVKANQQLCVPGLDLPGGTGAIQVSYFSPGPAPRLSVTALSAGRVVARGAYSGVSPPPPGRVTIPLTPALSARPAAIQGMLCFAVTSGGVAQFAGFQGLPSDQPHPRINGRPVPVSVALWFLPRRGDRRSLVQDWPTIMHRLTLFRPGFAGTKFYWILFAFGLPLLGYFAIRLLAVARQPGRHLVLGLALVALASAGVWAITTVPFDTPDESEHFAYTESLAETGRAPDPTPTSRQSYASDEVFALDALHHFSFIEFGDTRPPWFGIDQREWQRRVKLLQPSRNDGGGNSIATGVHSPLYYATLIPGYELGRSGGVFSELFWMRMISALLGAIVVVAAYATIRELIPARPELAVAGTLFVALEPMFSFMGGAVDNDNGVNAMAALAVYLTIRALRRGLTWWMWMALGLVCAALPVMKGTGFELFPAIALAVLSIFVLRRSRTTLKGIGIAVASFAVVAVVWGLTAGHFHRNVVPVPTGTGVASGQLSGKLTYIWEAFLPRLPFMSPHFASGEWPFGFIYIHRGFAGFGWYSIFFPNWVYRVITAVLVAAILLGLVAAWRFRSLLARRWRELAFLVLVIVGVFVGVELAYYSPTPRPEFLTPEQGRYAFTAAVPIVALVVAGLMRLPRRTAQAVAAIAVGAMICFAIASHLLYVAHNFT